MRAHPAIRCDPENAGGMIAGRFFDLDECDTGVMKNKIDGIFELGSYETHFDLGTAGSAARENIGERRSDAPCVLSE